IVLEHVPGGTLAKRLHETGRLPWREVVILGARVASGLAALHEAHLVHRDVKPANIILDEHGLPKLADFGLVGMAAGAATVSSLTGSGEVVGTPEYLSPEQAQG